MSYDSQYISNKHQITIHSSQINMTMGDGCPAQGVMACCVLANAGTEVVYSVVHSSHGPISLWPDAG